MSSVVCASKPAALRRLLEVGGALQLAPPAPSPSARPSRAPCCVDDFVADAFLHFIELRHVGVLLGHRSTRRRSRGRSADRSGTSPSFIANARDATSGAAPRPRIGSSRAKNPRLLHRQALRLGGGIEIRRLLDLRVRSVSARSPPAPAHARSTAARCSCGRTSSIGRVLPAFFSASLMMWNPNWSSPGR